MTKELRAKMDADTFKALLLLNGGGAVSLMTLLASVLSKDGYQRLAAPILYGIIILLVGMVLAIFHNLHRRDCSLKYEQNNMVSPPEKLFGIQLDEARSCFLQRWLARGSIIAFLVAGCCVAISTLIILPPQLPMPRFAL